MSQAFVFAAAFVAITTALTQVQTGAAQYEADIEYSTGAHLDTSSDGTNNLKTLVLTALKQGQSVAYIDALVNDAAFDPKFTVPDTFRTASGRIDTARVLAMLGNIQTAGHFDTSTPTGTGLTLIPDQFHVQADLPDQDRNAIVAPGQIAIGQRLTIPAL